MRVLLLGATGNLGSRLVPALLAHQHHVVAYVRSLQKLIELLTDSVKTRITIVEGDCFDSTAVANALRDHNCDALVNTAGSRESIWREQTLGRLVESVTSAAVTVGKERGRPLRAWLIGGMGSLAYPGHGEYKIQDFLPAWMTAHHRQTEAIMRSIPARDLAWSLLCVAMMYPESTNRRGLLTAPRKHQLCIGFEAPPEWRDHWIRYLPLVGQYLSLVPAIASYGTLLEDVADLIAEDLAGKVNSECIGHFVGMKTSYHQTVARKPRLPID